MRKGTPIFGTRIPEAPDPQDPDVDCAEWQCSNPVVPYCPAPLCSVHVRYVFAFYIETMNGGEYGPMRAAWLKLQAEAAHDKRMARAPRPAWKTNVDTPGHVYFVRIDDRIKIGWSSDYAHRIKQFTVAKFLHAQAGTQRHERALHEMFRHLRLPRLGPEMGSTEWFRAEPDLLDFIADLKTVKAA